MNRLSYFTSRCLALVARDTPRSLEMEAPPCRRSTTTVQVYPIGGNWRGKGGGPGGKGMGVSVLGDWDKVAVVLIFSQGTDEVEMGRTGERSV